MTVIGVVTIVVTIYILHSYFNTYCIAGDYGWKLSLKVKGLNLKTT